MRLVWKEHDGYNPVLILLGAGFLVVGGYPLVFMPGWSIAITWPFRAIFAILVGMGLIILTNQFQHRRNRRFNK